MCHIVTMLVFEKDLGKEKKISFVLHLELVFRTFGRIFDVLLLCFFLSSHNVIDLLASEYEKNSQKRTNLAFSFSTAKLSEDRVAFVYGMTMFIFDLIGHSVSCSATIRTVKIAFSFNKLAKYCEKTATSFAKRKRNPTIDVIDE